MELGAVTHIHTYTHTTQKDGESASQYDLLLWEYGITQRELEKDIKSNKFTMPFLKSIKPERKLRRVHPLFLIISGLEKKAF